jgi:hypothetical protein
LQTEGQQQFRFTWQLGVMIAVCLIALALPIASVLVTVRSLTRGASQQETNSSEPTGSGALENVLKGIADEKLGAAGLEMEVATMELIAADLETERRRVEELLNSLGGVAIPTSESPSEIWLLARIPQDQLAEFAAACFGERTQPPVGDLVQIVIRKGKEP